MYIRPTVVPAATVSAIGNFAITLPVAVPVTVAVTVTISAIAVAVSVVTTPRAACNDAQAATGHGMMRNAPYTAGACMA